MTDVVKQGWLYKKPWRKKGLQKKMAKWKLRWFVLSKSCMYYYVNESDSNALGVVPLDTGVVEIDSSKDGDANKFRFCIITPLKTFRIAADTARARDEWMEAIASLHDKSRTVSTEQQIRTILNVEVMEANLENIDPADFKRLNVYCIVQTSTQKYQTITRHQTTNPIWGELFSFDLVKFPCDCYVYLYVNLERDEKESSGDTHKGSRKRTVRDDSRGSEADSDQWKRVSTVETSWVGCAKISIPHAPDITSPESKQKTMQVLQIRRINAGSSSSTAAAPRASMIGGIIPILPSAPRAHGASIIAYLDSTVKDTPLLGTVEVMLSYVFEDKEGFHIGGCLDTYGHEDLGVRKRLSSNEPETSAEVQQAETASTSKRKTLFQRRYDQEVERMKQEKEEEEVRVRALEEERKKRLQEIEDKFHQEEERFQAEMRQLQKASEERRRAIETQLAQEEAQRVKELQEKLKHEEDDQKRRMDIAHNAAKLEDDQRKIQALMEFKTEQRLRKKMLEEKLKKEEAEKMREIEERIAREEADRRRAIQEKVQKEEEDRLLQLQKEVQDQENRKLRALERELQLMEAEKRKKQEFVEMQRLKARKLKQKLKKEEEKRLELLAKQLKDEELERLKSLEEKLRAEEEDRLKSLEIQMRTIEQQQREKMQQEIAQEENRIIEDVRKMHRTNALAFTGPTERQTSWGINRIELPSVDERDLQVIIEIPAPPPLPPPPKNADANILAYYESIKDQPQKPTQIRTTQAFEPTSEAAILLAKQRLRKVDPSQINKRKNKPNLETAIMLRLKQLREGTAMYDSDDDEEEEEFDPDDPKQFNPLINLIANRIAQIEEGGEVSDVDEEADAQFGIVRKRTTPTQEIATSDSEKLPSAESPDVQSPPQDVQSPPIDTDNVEIPAPSTSTPSSTTTADAEQQKKPDPEDDDLLLQDDDDDDDDDGDDDDGDDDSDEDDDDDDIVL